MSTTLTATLAGLVTAACFGAGDWLTPRSRRQLSAWQINFAVNVIGVTIYGVALCLVRPHWPAAPDMLRVAGGSLIISAGYVLFVKALTVGAVGVVVPLSSIYPLVTLLLSSVFLNQSFSHWQVLAMVVIVAGAVLLAYEKGRQRSLHQHLSSILTLVAVGLWGTGFFIINPLLGRINWSILVATLDAGGTLLGFGLLMFVYRHRAVARAAGGLVDPTIQRASLLLAAGTIALYAGAGQAGNFIIPLVLSSLSPLVSSGLAATVDREVLGWAKRLGALVAVAGVIILNVS